MLERYPLLYADPACRYDDKSLHRGGAERHYETCSPLEIAGHIEQFADPAGCGLAIWTFWPLQHAIEDMLRACGWRRRTILFLWIKTTQDGRRLHWGQGHHSRANSEAVFLWTRGRDWPRVVSHSVHQTVFHPVMEHSRKPDEVRHRIETLYGPIPRIELYHRGPPPPGWDAWGDEVEQPNTSRSDPAIEHGASPGEK